MPDQDHGSNHFDANAYLGTLDRPSLTVGKHTFAGRFLGVEDWLRFTPRLDQLAAGQLPPTEMRGLIRDLTNAIFPPPAWWRLATPWAYAELQKMPLTVQLKALEHFIRSQASALNPVSEEPPALRVMVNEAAALATAHSSSG